jgi:hypothetical protein
MRKLVVFLLLIAPAAWAATPQQGVTPQGLDALLDEQTFAVVRLDIPQVFGGDLLARLANLAGMSADELSVGRKAHEQLAAVVRKSGGKELYVVFSIADAAELPFFVMPLHAGADAKEMTDLLRELRYAPGLDVARIGQALVAGSPRVLQRLRALKPAPPADMAKANPFANPAALEALFLISPDNRRVFEELLPQLPPELGGGPVTTVTRGLQWVRLTGEADPLGFRLVIQAKDAESANALLELGRHLLKLLQGQKEVKRILPNVAQQSAMLLPRVEGDKLVLQLRGDDLTRLVQPLVANTRLAALQTQGANNLRQIGLAMHNYYTVHKMFPTSASYDDQGRPLLSWRVHLLPYLEQDAVYRSFHLNEPWDSEHNKQFIARMPAVFKGTQSKAAKEGKTVYLAPLGEQTMFPGKTGVRISDVTDGTSNTIFVVEADDAHAVEWTRPDDLKIDPKYPSQGLNRGNPAGFMVLFVDGSVQMLPTNINPATLWALFTRNGGEVIQRP